MQWIKLPVINVEPRHALATAQADRGPSRRCAPRDSRKHLRAPSMIVATCDLRAFMSYVDSWSRHGDDADDRREPPRTVRCRDSQRAVDSVSITPAEPDAHGAWPQTSRCSYSSTPRLAKLMIRERRLITG